jgi:polysaccharide chain length determinant protein (PEP-CTERM system associated)
MQATKEQLSTPRRPLDVEDYIDIVRRHKSWIIGPAFAALVIAVVAAFLWPDTYISQAAVRVLPSQVPEKLVPSNINLEMSQHINSMASSILSRTMLTNIIQTYGLYRRELSRRPMEDVIEQMQRAIRVGQVRDIQAQGRTPLSAFFVSYEYENRYLAQKVTQDLAGRFISENVRTRSDQSRETTQFLKDQWEAARKELDALEKHRTEFRIKNAGRLPEELPTNLQALRSLETQLNGVNEAVGRIGQEKLLLESQLQIQGEQLATARSSPDQFSASVKNERLVQMEREILQLETQLSGLRERYRDTHPDVQRFQSQIGVLKKVRDDLLKQETQQKPETNAPKQSPATAPRAGRELEAGIARLQSVIQAKDMELEERLKEQKQLRDVIKVTHSRIEARPLLEQQYGDLTRDWDFAKAKYDEFNRKMSQSEIATDLTNRSQAERLEMLDPASLPEKPLKPNRLAVVGVGLALGVMLGVFAAGFREVKDTSLKNLKDARAYTNLPVLGTVPLLENDLVARRKRRLVWLAWSAACVVGVLAMSGSIYYYYATKL